ncbi:MAG TPA: hypothetical protein PKI12_05000 [Bacteroidales bacterium]|nr:hypothetical protein [Bacteroidales bacterium]
MKKSISGIAASILFLLVPVLLSGQKALFDGTWNLDTSRVPATGSFPVLNKIKISLRGDSLLTERFYSTGDGQIYPITENLTLDGKGYSATVYDMERKTKASWKEKGVTILHEATTTAYGAYGPVDYKSTETWKVDSKSNILTISFVNILRETESTGIFIFNKATGTN